MLTTPFQTNETHSPCSENAVDSVLCTPTNDECQFHNWNMYCRSVLPVLLLLSHSSNQAPMIMFNMYMAQFTCSHHGIPIRGKSPGIWMPKEHRKRLVSYMNN